LRGSVGTAAKDEESSTWRVWAAGFQCYGPFSLGARFERIMSMKNSSETIGNRSRELPVCSAVPQPTAPPRASPPRIKWL
jgi:hypothetical protein